ncbi:MAG: tRNA dihydrouridine(20/20a) synthase DusA [Gammaproteobacteria bacterium]|nr:tRNA dihydrouridine(20/20a) synthase DusA [Gammaproteobacteria bacterium]
MASVTKQALDRTLSVAPMMDWTDRHCRYFHRLLAPSALLYTEMVTTGAVIHGDADRFLAYNPEEHPLALQLGGSEPKDLATCAHIAGQRGYDEINLNVGCPSDRVQRGRFGACLMLEPGLVKDCLAAMLDTVDIPVTIKTRLGVDDCYSYQYMSDFVGQVAESGCSVFVMHARKAFLAGLSPKQNRDVPPLQYDWVYRLKQESPGLEIVINGGIDSPDAVKQHLEHVDGVMLGRAAYHSPWVLAECQQALFENQTDISREDVIESMSTYLERQVREGVAVKHISRHMLGLFQGLPGAKAWRRYLSENAYRDDNNTDILQQALLTMKKVAGIQV